MRGLVCSIFIILLMINGNSVLSRSIGQSRFVDPDFYNGDTYDFTTDIYFVGSGSEVRYDKSNKIELSEWGTVDYLTETSVTLFALLINITGMIERNFGNVTYNEDTVDLGESLVFGQIYTILDGQINTLTGPELNENGMTVAVPLGDHILSVIYISMDEQDNYYYATDSIVFRVRKIDSITSFSEYKTRAVPLNLTYTDIYVDKTISGQVISFVSVEGSTPEGVYERNFVWKPEVEIDMVYNSTTIQSDDELRFINEDTDQIDILTVTNSTGFNDLQIYNRWDSTQGLSFLLDAEGIHEINDDLETVIVREGNNYVGVITLAPYGIWHKDIPHPVSGETNGSPDWDTGITSAINGSEEFQFDAAFDFTFGIAGVAFRAVIGEPEIITSTSIEDDSSLAFIWIIVTLPIIRRRTK